jgi:hypothetical protein
MTPATLGDELRTLYEAEAPRPPGNQPVPGVVNRSHFWQGRVAFWFSLLKNSLVTTDRPA